MNYRAIYVLATVMLVTAGLMWSGLEAYGQEETPIEDIPIEFSTQEVIIVIVGFFGGLTTAYLGYRKAKIAKPDLKFDITRFADRIVLAVIPAVGFAIAASADILAINAFSLYMVYTASLGTSELITALRERNTVKA